MKVARVHFTAKKSISVERGRKEGEKHLILCSLFKGPLSSHFANVNESDLFIVTTGNLISL